jgi:hypothetical protein
MMDTQMLFRLDLTLSFMVTEYSNVYLSTNGFLSFTALSNATYSNAQIPGVAVPNSMVAMFWDDLDGRTQEQFIVYRMEISFTIQFTNWQKYSGTGSLTFQVVIHQNGKNCSLL